MQEQITQNLQLSSLASSAERRPPVPRPDITEKSTHGHKKESSKTIAVLELSWSEWNYRTWRNLAISTIYRQSASCI